jgi:cobalt/nickel transport system permease protein
MAIVTTLGFVTPFTELMAALAWLRVPTVVIEIAHFAWRYLFLLFDDAKTIYGAQKNRLGYTGYRQGLRSFGTLTGSLVIKAFDNSRNVTTAMVQRGYDGTMPMLRHKPFRFVEVAASMTLILCMGFLWNI